MNGAASKREPKKKSKNPLFYACYLLSSMAPKCGNVVYIGSTPDPIRRLRQHNGEIAGGAKKTLKKRPWDMVIVVYGFPSKLAALQFEWAWQNPHKSRHFKNSSNALNFTGRQKERFLLHKLDALAQMFHLEHYNRWPLHVHFTSDSVYKKFSTFLQTPKHLRISQGSLATIPLQKISELIPLETNVCCCAICDDLIDLEKIPTWLNCTNKSCNMISHLICLSKLFLENDPNSLIPLQGTCLYCEKDLKWGDLILGLKSRSVATTKSGKVDRRDFALNSDALHDNDQGDDESLTDSDEFDEEFELLNPSQSQAKLSTKKPPRKLNLEEVEKLLMSSESEVTKSLSNISLTRKGE